MGGSKGTSSDKSETDIIIEQHSIASEENPSHSEEQENIRTRPPSLEQKSEGYEYCLMNKSKKKRNRRKERKKNKISERKLKVIGVNSAGLMSKIDSFEKLLVDENPLVFCIQETKLKKPNQIKTNSSKNFTIYELLRKNSNGGGLCIGVHKDLKAGGRRGGSLGS